MGKRRKKNMVQIAGPQHVTRATPLMLTFSHWDPAELPRAVSIEVFEIDRAKVNDDSHASAEDKILRATATLTADADDSAVLTDVAITELTSPSRGPNRVWVRLAPGGDVTEAGIPYSDAIKLSKADRKKRARVEQKETAATEGSFYEVAVRVRDGHAPDGEIVSESADTPVRQSAFLLLAVEPLSQNNSDMKHAAGKMILERFHPDAPSSFGPRKWAGVVLRLREHKTMRLHKSGCSYAVLAMLLRYLRIDAPPPAPDPEGGATSTVTADPTHDTTVVLFDHHIKLAELKASHAANKPRFIKDFEYKHLPDAMKEIPAARIKGERDAFINHFLAEALADLQANHEGKKPPKKLSSGQRKKLTKTFGKTFDAQAGGKGGALDEAPTETGIASTELYEPASHAIEAKDYIPLLAWKMNAIDGRELKLSLKRVPLSQHRLVVKGASDYTTLGHGEHEQWVAQFEKIPLDQGGSQMELLLHDAKGDGATSGIVMPVPAKYKKTFGLKQRSVLITDIEDDEPGDPDLKPWQRLVVATLERGLPIVAVFSPGQYSTRTKTGHFCIIVGFRYLPDPADATKQKIRFIINDPAGGRTHQYEAHDEEELTPQGKTLTETLRTKKPKKLGLKRERQGRNLIIDRRKLLSIREMYIIEPADKDGSTWDTNRHARFLYSEGKQKAYDGT